jgi:Cys-tRNA(Pro)/Cys-tRNA(Cys) deacylase
MADLPVRGLSGNRESRSTRLGGIRMSGKIGKTNAMRALEQRHVAYDTFTYSPEIHSADVVAETLGIPARRVYKTLVVLRERGGRPMLVMIAGDRELDPRATAKAVGEKRVAMAPKKDAERLTGLLVGGIGALALLNKGFEVYLDERALAEDAILVNGGQRGLNLQVHVADLVAVTGAKTITASAEVSAPDASRPSDGG